MNTEILSPSLNNSSICLHKISESKTDNLWDWHIHNECEFYMLIHGNKTFWVNDIEYKLNSGDIIFVNERVPHKTFIKKGSRGFLMQTGTEFVSSETNSNLFSYFKKLDNHSSLFPSGSEINILIRKCFENIISENSTRRKAYDLFIKTEVCRIFAVLYRNNILKNPDDYFDYKKLLKILPAIHYIDTHYKECVTLEQVSSAMNVNKSHLCRIFKQSLNISFVKYLNFVRCCHAENLLLTTDKSITEIAEQSGFSGSSYFSETFKSVVGCAPGQYRKIKLFG